MPSARTKTNPEEGMVNEGIRVMRRPWRGSQRWARTPAAIVVTVGLALLAACSGGSSSTGSGGPSTGGGATRSQSTNAQMLAYSRCLRSHGLPNFPDPDSNGQLDKSKITAQHLGVSDSQLQAAENSCQHLLPNSGGGRTQAQLQQEWSDARKFSRCMQSHGVPNFPDPTPYPPHPEDPTFNLHAADIAFHHGSDDNIVNSPQIEAKVQQCESLEHEHMSNWFN